MKMPHKPRFPRFARAGTAALCLCLLTWRAATGGVSEPHTVFYGKVLGTGSVQPFLITEGQLSWTILRSDGQSITLKTSLYAYHENTFSYRLDVPHSAFALGLDPDPDGIPMPPMPQTHLHASVSVDGESVELLGPASAAFTTEQLLRTATYRLDLGIGREASDTDGDGIPDWWEDRYGLDKQDPSDAELDLSGDGITALQAYLRGLDPNRDHRAPVLLTDEWIVYPAGSTAILLDTFDVDSDATHLQYSLTQLPAVGTLTLRNAADAPDHPDAVLAPGSVFTHADLLQGRLIYDHDGSENDPGFFGVEVRDENPDHPASAGLVRLLAYRPGAYVPGAITPLEARRLDNHLHADRGLVIMDASTLPPDAELSSPSAGLDADALADYLAAYGNDRRYVFIAGPGEAATLTGGHRNDILEAGPDGGILTGGAGADRFVFRSFESNRLTISDFVPADADVIDLSRLPAEPGAYLQAYVRLAPQAEGHVLQVDAQGSGSEFDDLSIALPGLTVAEADLYHLVENGNLWVGALRLEPRITVDASQPRASQSGPTEGRLTLHRQGSLEQPLTVNIAMTGSAINGTHYEFVPATVAFPAGISSVDVVIMPYATGQDLSTIAHLTVAEGVGYRVGAASSASVTIEPQMMVVELEVLEPVVVKGESAPYAIRVRRRYVTQTDAFIRLAIGGTAISGTDYDALNTFVYLAPGVANAFLEVTPKPHADLSAGARTVIVSVQPDEDYLIKPGAAIAQIALIERRDSFGGWREREFPEAEGDAETFAQSDDGNFGITHFQRYAFGLNPHQPDRAGLPRPFLHDGRLVVTFRRPLGLTDVTYRVTGLTDLTDPVGSVVPMTPIPAPDGSNDPERVYYQIGDTAAQASKAFAIINAEWSP